MTRIICDNHKCRYNQDEECTAATMHYADRLCRTFRRIRTEDVMQLENRARCEKRGAKYKSSGGRVLSKNFLTYSIIYGTIITGGEELSKWEKLLEKIRNNPKTVTFEEVDKVMKRLGYDGKFPRSGSSHCTYRKLGHTPVTVPRHEPYVKEEYVKQVIEAMDED